MAKQKKSKKKSKHAREKQQLWDKISSLQEEIRTLGTQILELGDVKGELIGNKLVAFNTIKTLEEKYARETALLQQVIADLKAQLDAAEALTSKVALTAFMDRFEDEDK